MPNLAQEVARAMPRPYSPQTLRKSPCSTAVKIYRTQGGSKPCLLGHGPYTFADEYCQLCCGVDMDTRTAVESGGWASGHSGGREGRAITGYRPLPGSGVLSQGQPFPGIYSLFIGDRREVCLGGAGPPLLPSLPVLAGPPLSTSLAFLCHLDPWGEMPWGRVQVRLERSPQP